MSTREINHNGEVESIENSIENIEGFNVDNPKLTIIGHTWTYNPGGGSTAKAMINFTKSMFGAGVLALPHAFTNSGLLLGIVAYIIAAVVCTYTMALVIKCAQHLRKEHNSQITTYSDLAHCVFGKWGRRTVHFLVVFLEISFCSGFVIAILENLQSIIPVGKIWILLVLAVILTFLSWIEAFQDLWVVSLFGFLAYLFGAMGATVVYGSLNWKSMSHDVSLSNWSHLPLFLGTTVYSLEGICLALPVESSMRHPKRANFVIIAGTFMYGLLSCSYGAFGYAAGYGSCDIITQCLPKGIIQIVIRATLSASLVATHPLTLYPATEIIELILFPPLTQYYNIKKKVLRMTLVLLTLLIGSLMGPNFTLFSAFVGSLMISVIGFLIPPLMFIKLFYYKMSLGAWIWNILVVLLGLVGMIGGTYIAVGDSLKG